MTYRLWLLLALLWEGLGFAQPQLRYKANLTIPEEALNLTAPVNVTFEIDGIEDGACLYVPAHDQKLRDLLLLESIRVPSPQEVARRQDLSLEWIDKGGIEHIGPALYRLPPGSHLSLSYALSLAGWRDRDQAPRILGLWHPVILKSCPNDDDQTFASPWPEATFDVTLNHDHAWQLAAPGEGEGGHRLYTGTSFNAVFFKQGKIEKFQIGRQTLLSLSKSKGFEQLVNFAKNAVQRFAAFTGKVQEPTLLLVETDDFEPIRTPGLVTLNTPQQPAMRYLQQDLTHWNVWQLSVQIAQQWYGLGCRANTIDDHWLVQGLADMLVYDLLSSDRQYFELFAHDGKGRPYLDLNYLQAQDLAAASLSLFYPSSSLTDADGVSHPATVDRPFIAYVRNSHMLRYLQWKLGIKEFQDFLREASARCSEESIKPAAFAELANTYRPGIGKLMKQYWQSEDWPDVSLNGMDAQGDHTIVHVHYTNDLLMPTDLWVTDKAGNKKVVFVEPLGPDVDVLVDEKKDDIDKLELNPGRAMFDKDRFNNRTGAPKLNFFPGSARGLADDAYTIVWLPFFTKLPGEPFTIDLALQSLAYLNSGLTGLVRYQPDGNRMGFNLIYLKAIPESSLFFMTKIAQDDGHVEVGERRIDFIAKRRPVFSLFPRFGMATRLRSKQILGSPRENHLTASINFDARSEPGRLCGHDEESEYESTIYVPSHDFSYQRAFGRLSLYCETKTIGSRLRLFAGATRAEGEDLPPSAYFRPQNLDEAHVRLDHPTLQGGLRINTFNFDTSFPARLPLPESWFILPRRSQFKVFVDGAKMQDPDLSLIVSGVGYSLPIGGDIAGKDTLTLFKFSLNGIFYRRLDHEVDTKPGILFDFSGNL